MKQPQLGKKISELRLGKGLTQTELAEQCNLSLRTIQRIETAQVTPRSYSIKLIFKNLDYDAYNPADENSNHIPDVYNVKKGTLQKGIILLIIITVLAFAFFKFLPNSKVQQIVEVNNSINESQINFKKWVNTNQVDSLLTLYRKDACWLNSICGKRAIGTQLQSIIDNGYEVIEYTILSISIADTIAIEKYHNLYKYKGNTKEQFGMIEWRLTNGAWLIVNDVFND